MHHARPVCVVECGGHLLQLCPQDVTAGASGPQLREIYLRLLDAHHG